MRKTIRSPIAAALGAALLPAVVGLSGCSGEGTVTTPKAGVEKKRDELQKATQPGIPGKTTGSPGGRRG